MRTKLISLFIFIFSQHFLLGQQIIDLTRLYGVTIDDVSNVSAIKKSLAKHCKKMTARIVFDEFVPATDYVEAVDSIHDVAFILGEILDSYYVDAVSVNEYAARTTEYLDAFEDKVDIWEIGNEINGEWVGNPSDVVAKITDAYHQVKQRGKKAELTLYYNSDCFDNAANEMFTWTKANVPNELKQGLDYVLVSYYEDDCNLFQPNWQEVFDSLHVLFPNSKIGMGECGTDTVIKKAGFIDRYYNMNISTPNYVGGYFWWYYVHDAVPYTQPLWNEINNQLCSNQTNSAVELFEGEVSIYNNTNSASFIFKASDNSSYTLNVYNALGEKIEQASAVNSLQFGSNFSSGIYFVTVVNSSNQSTVFSVVK